MIMSEFEETIMIIGIIIGVVTFMIFILWSFAKANRDSFEDDKTDTKNYKKDVDEISKKLDKLKETTNQDDVLPKGFKKDTD
jgi:FtsZ-interacting cell division protein ZipA